MFLEISRRRTPCWYGSNGEPKMLCLGHCRHYENNPKTLALLSRRLIGRHLGSYLALLRELVRGISLSSAPDHVTMCTNLVSRAFK
ncbi:hypothetical protein KC338_g285 [Hortaea werneckii]|nr:hypothetical protein KC338_g285 [Hortaea werneckii]